MIPGRLCLGSGKREAGRPVELTIRKYEGQPIGYVNLYYLIPEKRGTLSVCSKLFSKAQCA